MTLTKANIVEALSEKNGYPKKQYFGTVENLLEIMKRSLESGEDVLVSGFGKLCVKAKHERRERNPATEG
jgi:integration host factor subunit alpha